MASTAPVPVEQSQAKLSFAKVAASSYKPHNTKENQSNTKNSVSNLVPTAQAQNAKRATGRNTDESKERPVHEEEPDVKEQAGNTAARTGQWANTAGQQTAVHQTSKDDESDKTRPAIIFIKSMATEDSTTQLSSSDGSAKPPSLDGKSVASATTFALDEKESIRPDDSASLRAVEEEDITSPPDSVAAGSRVGSDSGVARAFRDQLHEIAVMGPHVQRGAPPGRFPSLNVNSPHTLYDPNQPQNGMGRPMTQPVVNGIPNIAGSYNLAPIPDEKLIEALESPRDRLFVLKLEQDFIDFIKDSRENELALPNTNTFYRMLAHRLADYYLLGHTVDDTMTGVKIARTQNCRIPPPLSGLPVSSKNANTPPVDFPARKIMRRGGDGKSGTNTTANSEGPSKTTSEAGGGSGSEGGNDGNAEKEKSALTREEREARYREARQRIFGNSENGEGESTEAVGSGEEQDISRSSSASGKKKTKKQRIYDDDFEARSRFNAYYPQQYPIPTFSGDQTMYYGGYPGQMHNPQFPAMNANMSPPPSTYNGGYPAMMPQEAQAQYGWAGQYQPPNGPLAYPNYGPPQNGYDLSAEFNRSMQSFQSAPLPSQATPKMSNAPMAPYQESYQPQPIPMNGAWPQMNQQSSYPMPPPPYAQNGSSNRPVSAPLQSPMPGQYPYGQLPPSPYNGKSNRNQHPIPGSFNRQQFNPQSQTFVPGGRNASYQMQSTMAPIPALNMNGYGGFQVPIPNQMPRPSPPTTHIQTFGSPRNMNTNPVPMKPTNLGPMQSPQIASSHSAVVAPPSSQPSAPPIPAQSSIAKYGTPSHLPPKPPAPAQAPAPKYTLPNHSNFPVSRPPNTIAPGFTANSPMIIGGTGPGMPNNKS